MMKTYLLSEKEVELIEKNTGIKLTEKPLKHPFWDYAYGEIESAVSMLDENDFSEEVLVELRKSIDGMTQVFIDDYMLGMKKDIDAQVVTDALDEVYNVVVQRVDEKACEIRDDIEN